MERNGRGQYRAMAKHMRVHSSLLSHVFRGPKDLTLEQACSLAEFLHLEELEADYLLAMVDLARSGTTSLKASVERRMKMLRDRQSQIEHRLPLSKTLTPEQQATFYSQWYYSAVRLSSSLEGNMDATSIAGRLKLPVDLVVRALNFLVSAGLVERRGNQYCMEANRTHLGATSMLTANHHRNWRLKAMSMYDNMRAEDFAFTSAMALAKDDFKRLRELFVDCVASASKIIEPSKCETLALLNIDFLEF